MKLSYPHRAKTAGRAARPSKHGTQPSECAEPSIPEQGWMDAIQTEREICLCMNRDNRSWKSSIAPVLTSRNDMIMFEMFLISGRGCSNISFASFSQSIERTQQKLPAILSQTATTKI